VHWHAPPCGATGGYRFILAALRPHLLRVIPLLVVLAPGAAFAASDRVLVLPFRNSSGTAGMDYLIAGAPGILAEKLEGIGTVRPAYGPRLLPPGALAPSGDGDAVGRAAAEGARYVFVGSFKRLPNWDIEFDLKLLEADPRGPREIFRGRGAGPKDQQLSVLDRLLLSALESAGLMPQGAALERLRRAVTRDAYAFYLYGKALGAYHALPPGPKKDLEKAESNLRRVQLIDPKFLEARRFLALVLHETGDGRAARAEYTTLFERRPTYFWPLESLARLYRDEGNRARALEFATRAVEVRPYDAECRFVRGSLLWELGRLEDAHRELRRAVTDAPRHADARRLLAQVSAARGLYEEQARELEAILALQPEDLQARLDLGATYRRLERWDDAVRVYDEVCRRSPRHLMANRFLRGSPASQGRAAPRRGRLRAGHAHRAPGSAALLPPVNGAGRGGRL
jgi:tetratricopeptide (TPR) repeat protein